MLMLLYNGAHLIAWKSRETAIKKEVERFLKKDNAKAFLTTLVFGCVDGQIDSPDFFWEEENKEFMFHHQMYDVVSINWNRDSCEMRCYRDTEETDLRKKMKKSIADSEDAEGTRTVKIFVEDFILEPRHLVHGITYTLTEVCYFDTIDPLSFCHGEVPPRPPKSTA